ncbi:hypothetical protein TorRG33x02_073660 [Trema orientale]|uniref:Uncharacterized protein n=1 Tax=Trema orientale TaxID=63057 RepID=A0A2P5FGR1_TREOI|nr:hypothetical protein TorRG33x02_073660 [Trema orientale]
MENTPEANTVLEDLVDLNNGVVRFVGSTIRDIVYMQYHLRRHHLLFNFLSLSLLSLPLSLSLEYSNLKRLNLIDGTQIPPLYSLTPQFHFSRFLSLSL